MTKHPFAIAATLLLGCTDSSETRGTVDYSNADSVTVEFTTNAVKFEIEVDFRNAPISGTNFMRYVNDGFYDGQDGNGATIFHRVINDFMIQGGGYTQDGSEKDTYEPIENEAAESGLSNIRGAVAMARLNDPDSATSQFFINTLDNVFLDAGQSQTSEGYAVFGFVTKGMDIVDTISELDADESDRPLEDIIIQEVYVVGSN